MTPDFNAIYHALRSYHLKLTPGKVLNGLSLGAGTLASKWFGRSFVWGMPAGLFIEPTNLCNLKCPMCPSGNGEMKRPTGYIDLDLAEKVLDELAPYLFVVQFWHQGEPMLHKQFHQLVRMAHDRGIVTMTSTNGHFIKTEADADAVIESGLDEMILSVDGMNQESYSAYRVGGSLQKVMSGLELLQNRKIALKRTNPVVNLQFIVMKTNEGETEEFQTWARKMGVEKFSLKTAQLYTEDQADTFLSSRDEFNRYQRSDSGLMIKSELPNFCKQIWLRSLVNFDGRISPCCYDKDEEHVLGDLEKQSFREIWFGAKYRAFRNRVLNNRSGIDICRNCTEGLKLDHNRVTLSSLSDDRAETPLIQIQE